MKNIFKKRKSEDVEEIDGGTISCGGTRRTWENNAQKTIHSTEITRFELQFNLVAYVMEKEERESGFFGYFDLRCEIKDGKAVGKYDTTKRFDGGIKETFETNKDFLVELDKIIKEEDFAELNGYTSHTAGLPEMFGNYLNVDYASGENLYTSNNQSIDLPMTGLRRIKELFDSALKAKTSDAEPIEEDEPEDFDAGWVCECGTVNTPGTKYCYNCGMPKPGVDPYAECICGLTFLGKNVPDRCPVCGASKKDFM